MRNIGWSLYHLWADYGWANSYPGSFVSYSILYCNFYLETFLGSFEAWAMRLMFVLKWINLSNYTYWVSRLRVSPKYNWQLFVVFVFFCMEVISIPKWGTCGSANIYPQKIYVTIFFVTFSFWVIPRRFEA